MKTMPRITERTIRAMPYDTRLRLYEKEKNEMFERLRGASARDMEEAHKKLDQKWKV